MMPQAVCMWELRSRSMNLIRTGSQEAYNARLEPDCLKGEWNIFTLHVCGSLWFAGDVYENTDTGQRVRCLVRPAFEIPQECGDGSTQS